MIIEAGNNAFKEKLWFCYLCMVLQIHGLIVPLLNVELSLPNTSLASGRVFIFLLSNHTAQFGRTLTDLCLHISPLSEVTWVLYFQGSNPRWNNKYCVLEMVFSLRLQLVACCS